MRPNLFATGTSSPSAETRAFPFLMALSISIVENDDVLPRPMFQTALCFVMTMLLVGCSAVSVPPGATAVTPQQAQQIDALLSAEITANHVPGIQLAIARGAAVVYSKSYGFVDLTSKTPLATTTTMRIGSVSKQFTAACILLLQQDGVLSIDDRLSRWVPELTFGN